MKAGIEEQALYAKILGVKKLLEDAKNDLDVLQEFSWDNDRLRLVEDAIWCVCDARDDIKELAKDYWNG